LTSRFGNAMPRRTRKQRIARIIAVVSAILLFLTFVIKEVLKDSLKDLHDSVAQAESQFRIESGQSDFSVQMLLRQQQDEILKLQEDKRRNELGENLPALIAQDTASARLAWANVNANFDAVSRLIDRLPSGAKDLRQLRETVRTSISYTNDQANKALNAKTTDDVNRFVVVKGESVIALLQKIDVILLGDAALTRAHQVQEATEYLIGTCTRASWVLGILGAALGIYSAVTTIKSGASE
jgi:hypothetical protein